MKKEARPYQIAEICYNPEWPDTPWYVMRSGTVAEQGGLALGTETISFKTVEDACEYLSEAISIDMDVIKDAIKAKESKDLTLTIR